MENKPDIQIKAQNISTDLHYLKQLVNTSPVLITNMTYGECSNIMQLSELLKNKNSKYNFTNGSHQEVKKWIKSQGRDISPIINRVNEMKGSLDQKKQDNKLLHDCRYYIPNLGFENHHEYIQRNKQFAMLKSQQKLVTDDEDQGSLSRRILYERDILIQFDPERYQNSLILDNFQPRNAIKRNQYIKTTFSIFFSQQFSNIQNVSWPRFFQQCSGEHFWTILTQQISELKSRQQSKQLSSVAIASLSLIEEQFNQILPKTIKGVQDFITNKYYKPSKSYQNLNSNSIWGICYMLYKAGRRQEIYKLIQDQALKKAWEQIDQSIKNKEPKKYQGQFQKSEDIFLNQLIYILKGQFFSFKQIIHNDEDGLDTVWLFLRNFGIFQQDKSTFLKFRSNFYDRINKQSYKKKDKIKFLLYLIAYGEVAEIGTNEMMDKDDFVHYLITIYHSPAYNTLSKQKKQAVEKKLTQTLIQYIYQMVAEKRDEYLAYILLMPQKDIAEEISTIISGGYLLEKVNWNELSLKLDQKIFKNLLGLTCKKYALLHQNYLQLAKLLYYTVKDYRSSLNYLIQYLLYSFEKTQITSQEIEEVISYGKNILTEDVTLCEEYEPIFSFFIEYLQILILNYTRNEKSIYQYFGQCKFILMDSILTKDLEATLNKLIQNNRFSFYIKYLKLVFEGFSIYYNVNHQQTQRQNFEKFVVTLISSLVCLLKRDGMKKFMKQSYIEDFFSLLYNTIGHK